MSDLDSSVAEPASLPAIIYRKLRHDILNGVLRPGQLLRQEELSRRFNASRVPLREAMSQLAAEGLVVLRPRRGYAVTSLEPAEILEIFELRAVVEEHAGFVAAYARTSEDVDAVEHILETMKGLDPGSSSYLPDWLRWNYEFHGRIIASTRRERLTRFAGTLRDSVEPYIRVEVQMTGHVRDAEEDHDLIFTAYRARDARDLATQSRRHVENTARRLLSGLRGVKASVKFGSPAELGERKPPKALRQRAAVTPK